MRKDAVRDRVSTLTHYASRITHHVPRITLMQTLTIDKRTCTLI
jgi:hypothetical protein